MIWISSGIYQPSWPRCAARILKHDFGSFTTSSISSTLYGGEENKVLLNMWNLLKNIITISSSIHWWKTLHRSSFVPFSPIFDYALLTTSLICDPQLHARSFYIAHTQLFILSYLFLPIRVFSIGHAVCCKKC